MSTFYGRPAIPIGFTRAGPTNEESKSLKLAIAKDDGAARDPHHHERSSNAPPATELLRQMLAGQPDHSVVLIQLSSQPPSRR